MYRRNGERRLLRASSTFATSAKTIDIDDPFAVGAATEKPIRYLGRVPGSPEHAVIKYDLSQAMSFVATHRNNAEERVTRQAAIPHLLNYLTAAG
jgi:hypothetical protein